MTDYIDDEGQAYAQIKRVLDEFNSAELTLDNFKNFANKLNNQDTIIISQIENFKRDYVTDSNILKQKQDDESFRNSLEEGYVSRDVYEILLRMNKVLKDVFSWKTIQQEMYRILFDKLFELIRDVNALSIKRDALKEMREMEEKRNEVIIETTKESNKTTIETVKQLIDFTKEVVNEKLEISDTKINNFYKTMLEQMRIERNEMYQSINSIIDLLAKNENKEKFNSIKKKREEQSLRVDDIFSSESPRKTKNKKTNNDNKEVVEELDEESEEEIDEVDNSNYKSSKNSDIDDLFNEEFSDGGDLE